MCIKVTLAVLQRRAVLCCLASANWLCSRRGGGWHGGAAGRGVGVKEAETEAWQSKAWGQQWFSTGGIFVPRGH